MLESRVLLRRKRHKKYPAPYAAVDEFRLVIGFSGFSTKQTTLVPKIMKLPAVYIYKKVSDQGQELKFSLRSLPNVKNWDGRVFICGDTEGWFSDKITVIDSFVRSHIKWVDQQNKLRAIIADKRVPDDFIYFNDDMYAVEPTTISPLYDGRLETVRTRNGWQQAKADTKALLEREHNIHEPRNYDIHVPMIFNKTKLAKILDEIDNHPGTRLQPRSMYGNFYQIGGKQYKDRKTQTSKLRKGDLLSTRVFVRGLKDLFPDKSEFEK